MNAKRYLPRVSLMIGSLALIGLTAGCSSQEHQTQVVLPNGISCQSTTRGHFFWADRSLSCTDQNGKVIGSYKSD